MIVRTLHEIENTSRDVHDANWRSRRLLLERDNMGFSLHITTIRANSQIELCYENHLEAVYCVKGSGSVTDLATNKVHEIYPGTIYALDGHDHHILKANDELEFVCVFNPPVTGQEVHDENGSYALKSAQMSRFKK